MRLVVVACSAIALSGCAMSSKGLALTSPEMQLTSTKSPQAVAMCVVDSLQANPQIRNVGDHYWIVRTNAFDAPVSRWDFKPNGSGGTNVELRATININSGDEKVKACL